MSAISTCAFSYSPAHCTLVLFIMAKSSENLRVLFFMTIQMYSSIGARVLKKKIHSHKCSWEKKKKKEVLFNKNIALTLSKLGEDKNMSKQVEFE